MAPENRAWGDTRIRGARGNLGHQVARGPIANVRKEDDRTAKEAVHVYGAAIQLVLTAMEIGFTNGQITLAPPLVEYLKARGTIRPDEKDE